MKKNVLLLVRDLEQKIYFYQHRNLLSTHADNAELHQKKFDLVLQESGKP